jgi:ElaB/YqjD/DUF883 family membrane-anchored ribosome-binding protein
MTIEQEASDCVYPENNPMDAFWKSICDEHPCIGEELESIRFRVTKALKAKQDRIEVLEKKLELAKEELTRWQDSACRLEGNLDTALSTIETLESALKECVEALKFVCTKTDHMNDGDKYCEVCGKIDSALDRAKKALGGGA